MNFKPLLLDLTTYPAGAGNLRAKCFKALYRGDVITAAAINRVEKPGETA
jgi:hypothetical protein